MKKLKLTKEEAYTLSCIMGYVRYSDETRTLLSKVNDILGYELGTEDYDKVGFTLDTRGCGADVTIDFTNN